MSTDVSAPAALGTAAPSGAKKTTTVKDNLWRTAVILGLLALWAVLSLLSDLVSSPAASFAALAELFANGSIYRHLSTTLEAVAIGFLVAAAIASRLVERHPRTERGRS